MPTSTGTVATKPRKNGIFDNVDVTKRSLLFKCLRVARSHRENTAIPSTEGLSEGHCHNPLQNNGLKNGYSRTTKTNDDLLLHLIATHHGSGRPFADGVVENDFTKEPFRTPELFGQTFELPTSAQQIAAWNA